MLNDKFEHYRKGLDWDKNDRLPYYTAHSLPRRQGGVRAWPGTRFADFAGGPGQPQPYDDRQGYATEDVVAHPVNQDSARRRALDITRKLVLDDWKFKKLLGWGGNGVAALFRHKDGRMWVIKTSLEPGGGDGVLKESAKLNVCVASSGSQTGILI